MLTLRNLGILALLATSSLLFAQQSNAPISYFYDGLGRLIRVVDNNGNVATYNYDAVGNIVSITRSTTGNSLAILSFTPQQGSIGQTVTLQGQGFSTTASANTVKFNGTTAVVSAATATSLTVLVPTGATTGAISVTVGTQTATSSTNFTIVPATLVSVQVSPATVTVVPGGAQYFTATANYSNGTQQDVTTQATWTSSNPSTVSILDSSPDQGFAFAPTIATAGASITAAYNGVTGFASFNILAITIAPQSPTIPYGTTLQFTATGTFPNGTTQNLTATSFFGSNPSSALGWVSNSPSVATISNSAGTQGLADGVSVGSSYVCMYSSNTAQENLVSPACTTLTVTQGSPVSLTVSPVDMSIPKGAQQQFTATGTFPDGSTRNLTSQETWSSSNPAAATISNAAGSQGLVTAVAVGTTSITAASGSTSNSTTLTITAPVPTSLAVSPSTASLQPGSTQQLTATFTMTDGTTQDATQTATWSTSNSAAATVSNTQGSQGLVTGVAVGPATITATSGSLSSSAVVIVNSANASVFPRFLYTGNGDGSISTYGITGSTGQLRFNGYSPGVSANVLALDPQQQFLFGAGTGPNSAVVSVYAVSPSNGSLTQVSGSPFATALVSPDSVVTDPSGKFLYVGDQNSAQVSGFAIDRTSGALTSLPGSPYTTAGYTYSLLVHPSGKYLFVTNYAANAHGSVSVFSIDPTTGALTEISGSPFVTGVSSVSLAQDPLGDFLLVANKGQNRGSSLRPMGLPGSIDNIEVVTHRGSGSLGGIFSAGGRTEPLTDAEIGSRSASLSRTGPLVASLDLANSLPFVGSAVNADLMPPLSHMPPLFFQSGTDSGPCISVFAVDAASGTLTEVPGSPFTSPNGSGALTVAPSGQFVYVFDSNSFAGFALNSNTGALTKLAGSPYAAPYTYYAAWDPTGQFLYASGRSASTGLAFIEGFSLNSSTGTLTSIGSFPALSLTSALAVSSGAAAVNYLPQFAFVASGPAGANGVSAYSIDPTAGALTLVSGSPFADGLSPVFAASGTSGNFLYLVNQCSEPTCTAPAGSVSAYAIDPNTGVPTPVPGSPFLAGENPGGIAFDPSGQFAYVINDQDGTVSIYTVDPSAGTLTPISGSPFLASIGSAAAAIDPFEPQFLVAAKCPTCANGSLYVYGLYDPNIGQWAGLNQTLALGIAPTALAVDPAGYFAFVTDGSSDSVYVFSIAYSSLTQVAGSPFAAGQNPVSIAVDPTGRFAYVANQASNNVSAYTIDPVLGTLTPLASSPFSTGASPVSASVDYSGKFLYVVNGGDNTVSAFSIDPVAGALTAVTGSPFPVGAAPVSVTTTGKIQ